MTDTHVDTDIHTYFGLTYSNYLILHRTLMQSMPEEWQHRFVGMLEELDQAFRHVEKAPYYEVTAAVECEYSDLNEADMRELGITQPDAPDGGGEDAEIPDVFYDKDGGEHQSWERLLVPRRGGDPIPRYDRGRTFVEPLHGTERLGELAAGPAGYIVLLRERDDRWADNWDGLVHPDRQAGDDALAKARAAGYEAILTAATQVTEVPA